MTNFENKEKAIIKKMKKYALIYKTNFKISRSHDNETLFNECQCAGSLDKIEKFGLKLIHHKIEKILNKRLCMDIVFIIMKYVNVRYLQSLLIADIEEFVYNDGYVEKCDFHFLKKTDLLT